MMTSIKIVLSCDNNAKAVQIPVVPDILPSITRAIENDTITTHSNTLTLLGNRKPRSFSLDLFLPTKDYDFCKGNGQEVLDLIEYVTNSKIRARLVITDNLAELANIAIAINSYQYSYDTAKNIRATIDCSEYIFLAELKTETVSGKPEFSNITVYYNNKASRVAAANINGSNLVKTRDIVTLLGRDCWWNAEKKRVGCGKVLLDIHTEIYDGTAYCYIRDIASTLGLGIEYNNEDKSVTIKDGE